MVACRLAVNFIENNPSAHCNIQRMLGSRLGNFNTSVAKVNRILLHPVNLISENQRKRLAWVWIEGTELNTLGTLLYCPYFIILIAQCSNGLLGIFFMSPSHRFGGAECGFLDIAMGRTGGVAAKDDFLHQKGIGTPKNGAYVTSAADVLQNDHHRKLLHLTESLRIRSVKLLQTELGVHKM